MTDPLADAPESIRERIADLRGTPRDIAKWMFWVKLREGLDPRKPEQLRMLYPLWRAQHAAARGQRALMADEYQRWMGGDVDSYVRDAYRVAFRVHLEELLLGKLDARTWGQYMAFQGHKNLDKALARGKGVVLLKPHAGNIMLLIAALAYSGYRYTQYAARGMAPPEVAAKNPETFGINRWRREARDAREANEDNLPARFLTLETSARELYRTLGRGEIVGIAFDGRIGNRFVKVPYLGREALLNSGPYRLAAATGAAIVPALCACPAEGRNTCTFGEPIISDDPRELLEKFLRQAVEPWLAEHPGEYGIWLAHCRERAAVDDHPLFIDYAPDDRWRKYESETLDPEPIRKRRRA